MRIAFILLLSCCLLTAAEVDKRVAALDAALQTSDYHAKKRAVDALAGVKDDDQVYDALIRALGDRQLDRVARNALQSRSGLKQSSTKGGNPGYPGYPTTNDAAGWREWNNARKQELKTQEEIKAAQEQADKAAKEAAAAQEQAKEASEQPEGSEIAEGTESSEATESSTSSIATDSGENTNVPEMSDQLDRIIFSDGSVLVCYITAKRIDLQGNLTSVSVRHRNGGGEEDIEARIIVRIEEDIR